MTQYVSNWYCENCIHNLFTKDEYGQVNKYASMVAVLLFNLILSSYVFKGR